MQKIRINIPDQQHCLMSLALSSDQLNQISGKFLDSNGKTLAFAVKKGTINHSHSLFTVISTEDQALFVVRSWLNHSLNPPIPPPPPLTNIGQILYLQHREKKHIKRGRETTIFTVPAGQIWRGEANSWIEKSCSSIYCTLSHAL
jgi:hypothetical protein